MKKKILVIGATSTIAEQCLKIWAKRGDELYLIARNKKKLAVISKNLKFIGAAKVYEYCTDLNEINKYHLFLSKAEKALISIDIVLIAHGTLSNQKHCEKSIEKTLAEIKINGLSTVSLLTLIANHFELKKRAMGGTIAVMSSIAGDLGRAKNYVYGSAKAMVTTFMSGLRQRLHKNNISVVTIKLGLVETAMTKSFKKNLLWSKSDFVAKKIVYAIDKRQNEVVIPFFWRIIMLTIKALPQVIFKKLNF
jgi:short-subunit dehydrogenase